MINSELGISKRCGSWVVAFDKPSRPASPRRLIYRNRRAVFVLTLTPSENTLEPMIGATGTMVKFVRGSRILGGSDNARADMLTSLGRFLRMFLAAIILFSCAPVSASHVKSHFASDSDQAQVTMAEVSFANSSAQPSPDDGAMPMGGLGHHYFCGGPCLEAFPARSSYESAYSDGMRVRYPAYLDALAPMFEPTPLREPPRAAVSA